MHQTSDIYDNCACDGQFSEAMMCREPMQFGKTTQITNLVIPDIRSEGFCSNYRSEGNNRMRFIWAQGDYREISLSCPEYPKLVFIFIQGGHHVELSTYYGITTFLDPVMRMFQSALGSCWDRVRILYAGSTVCSDDVVKKYPHQKRENVEEYNRDTANWLKEHYPNAESVNFYNLSAESLDRTSDGMHSLTDVNLIKAMTVLNIMHHMARNSSHSE